MASGFEKMDENGENAMLWKKKMSRKTGPWEGHGKALGVTYCSFQANSLPAPGPAVVKRLDHEVEEIRRARSPVSWGGASLHVAPGHVPREKGELHV